MSVDLKEFPACLVKQEKQNALNYVCAVMFTGVLLTIAKRWNHLKFKMY